MIYIAKIFSLILGMAVITKTVLDYRKKQESTVMLFFWTFTWIAIIYVALNPLMIDKTIAKIGDHKTGLGTFISMSIVFLYFVIYRVYNKANRIEQKLKDIVIKLGLKNLDKN